MVRSQTLELLCGVPRETNEVDLAKVESQRASSPELRGVEQLVEHLRHSLRLSMHMLGDGAHRLGHLPFEDRDAEEHDDERAPQIVRDRRHQAVSLDHRALEQRLADAELAGHGPPRDGVFGGAGMLPAVIHDLPTKS